MPDWTYQDAYMERLRIFMNEQQREQDAKDAAMIDRWVRKDMQPTLDMDIPPSVVAWYQQGEKELRKADSQFPVSGSPCFVTLNPNDTLTVSNATNLTWHKRMNYQTY